MEITLSDTLKANNLCLSKNPYGSDKEFPKRYLSEIYEKLIGDKRNKRIKFLEIGVRTGASVELWSKYFTQLEFIGIDNGKDVVWQNESWVSGQNIRYLKADAYSHVTLGKIPSDLDVIVDDGPHSLESQIWAAKFYTEKLAPGGLLIIEDIQGGLRYCDEIIDALPNNFGGCARIFDLRALTLEGDALVVCVHNCSASDCGIPGNRMNEMNIGKRILRQVKYEHYKYHFQRTYRKIKFKVKQIAS
jgi:hypothetical protein